MNIHELFAIMLGGFNNTVVTGALTNDVYFKDVKTGIVALHRHTPDYFLVSIADGWYLHKNLVHHRAIAFYIPKLIIDNSL